MCKSFMTSESCGKCIVSISDEYLAKNLDIVAVTRLCAHMLWLPEVSNFREGSNILSSGYITCTGGIHLNKDNISNINNRDVCSTLLVNWCKTHMSDEGRLPYQYIMKTSEKLARTLAVQNLRTETLKLERCVTNLITCAGRCTEITMNKEVSKCTFTLDKISTTTICDGSTLLHILNTIIFTLLAHTNKHFTFNSKKIYVKCDGTIRLNDGYKMSIKPLYDTKIECTKLIESWCIRNISNDSKVERMNGVALLCQESTTMNELYKIVSGVYTDL